MGLQTAFASPDETFSPLITFSLTHHQSPQWSMSIWTPVITISLFPLQFGPIQRRPTARNCGPSTVSNAHSSDEENNGPSHPSGSCCAVPGKHRTHNTRFRVSTTEVARLMARLSIASQLTAITLQIPERKEAETSVERLTAAVESAPTVTAPHLKSKTGSRVPSAFHRIRCQAQKLGTSLRTFAR